MILQLGKNKMTLSFCRWQNFKQYQLINKEVESEEVIQYFHYALKPKTNEIYLQFHFNYKLYQTKLKFPAAIHLEDSIPFFQNQKIIRRKNSFRIEGVFVDDSSHFWMAESIFNYKLPKRFYFDEYEEI